MSKLYVAVRERKDRPGKWLVDVRRGAERHPRTFDSYPEARDFANAVERAERDGELKRTPEVPRIRTLAEVCRAYLEGKEGAERSKETINTYRYLLERGALPRLGPDRNLAEVNEEHIRASFANVARRSAPERSGASTTVSRRCGTSPSTAA